jgi:peroxiredoxin
MKIIASAFLTLLFLGSMASATPEGVVTLEPGAKAPDFDLPGIDGKNHQLSDYDDADILAVLFTCNHCPSAQGAESRIKALVERYRDQSFQLVAISPNADKGLRINELGWSIYGDSFEDMKLHAAEYDFNFPYLYDGETQSVSRAYGAMATPHIFIFDKERILRYVGQVDDSRFGDPSTVETHNARDAIDALLAGRPVAIPQTRAHGCSTKWLEKAGAVKEFDEKFAAKEVTLETINAEGVKKLAANGSGKLRLINLWATWCGPCVNELPELVKIGRRYANRGFDMITISTDDPKAGDEVLKTLKQLHVAMPDRTEKSVTAEGRSTNNYLFDGKSDALAEALDPKWQGPLPYTVLIDSEGNILHRVSGEVDPTDLRRVIVNHLGRWYMPK